MNIDITQNSNILAVDDSLFVLTAIQHTLSDKYSVQLAQSAEYAYQLLEKSIPDLILLDLEMPRVNGYEFLEELKKHPEWKAIPVIFLTGADSRKKEDMALTMGAVDYILKPIMEGVLTKRIKMHLEFNQYKKNLDRMVSVKTEQLLQTQERLRETAEIAEASLRAEIKIPADRVIKLSKLALEDDIPGRTRDYLNKIMEHAASLLQILEDIPEIPEEETGGNDPAENENPGAPENGPGAHPVQKPVFDGDVLVCEDDKGSQRFIREQLDRIGLRSTVADNGEDGVDEVLSRIHTGAEPFDMILMDMQMPVMDGIKAASLIAGFRLKTPIIALTANTPRDQELYVSSGLSDCVNKPFDAWDLWNCLLKHLKPVRWEPVSDDARNQDNQILKEQLQADFIKSNLTKYLEIEQAVSKGDMHLARRLSGALKINADIINEARLKDAAQKVEETLKEGAGQLIAMCMKELGTELSAVLKKLTPLQADRPPKNEEPPFDPEPVRDLLGRLEDLLQNKNPGCIRCSEELRGIPGAENLVQQVEDLEFIPALETLAKLKIKLEL